jgi:hypothetical protein
VFDPFWASFRAGVGGDDFLVAVQPWVEGSFLVFMRKSIWLATINQFASTDGSGFSVDTPVSNLQLLTDEVGCSARRASPWRATSFSSCRTAVSTDLTADLI